MRLRPFAAAFSLVLVLAACGSDERADRDDRATITTTAPSTEPNPTTTSPPASTTAPLTCPTGVGVGPMSPEQAVRCFYAAWKEANRPKAEAVASSDAVDSLFAQRWSPPEGTLTPCTPDPQTGVQLCSYDHHGAIYLFDVRPSEGGWRVTQVQGPLHGE